MIDLITQRPRSILALAMLLTNIPQQLPAAPDQAKATPLEIVLVEAPMVTPATVAQWKKEKFHAVAVVLDEQAEKRSYADCARHISEAGLDLYCWIEVARNPKMAAAHPRWMAALGSHDDWQKNFPNAPEPAIGEVAKAFPWVPIVYAEAFDAHLARIEELLQRLPNTWRGLLLNDLQGGPSACGCGNVQCRWAVDYHVPSTAAKLPGADAAARFTAEVRQRLGDKPVIPVWTTECAEVDLPPDKNRGRPGTGMCGTVGCATSACSEVFARQWTALTSDYSGPIGLLAAHTSLYRTQKEFGGGTGWVTNAMAYLDYTLPAKGAKTVSPDRLWVVVEGLRQDEETIARTAAIKSGAGAVIVARVKIDQSYEPRIVRK